MKFCKDLRALFRRDKNKLTDEQLLQLAEEATAIVVQRTEDKDKEVTVEFTINSLGSELSAEFHTTLGEFRLLEKMFNGTQQARFTLKLKDE